MVILIFALCIFLDFFMLIGMFIASMVQGFYQKRIPGLDYNSLVETAFLEGHYYGKYWNHKNNAGKWTWMMPNSYIKKKALEFKENDSNKIIKYRKRLVKAMNIETTLFVIMMSVHAIATFISFYIILSKS